MFFAGALGFRGVIRLFVGGFAAALMGCVLRLVDSVASGPCEKCALSFAGVLGRAGLGLRGFLFWGAAAGGCCLVSAGSTCGLTDSFVCVLRRY